MPPWKGSAAYVASVGVAPDGQKLVTTWLDGKVIVWDVLTGKRLHEWAADGAVIHPIAAMAEPMLALFDGDADRALA